MTTEATETTWQAGHPPWLAELPPEHAQALTELWREAVERRGWSLVVHNPRGATRRWWVGSSAHVGGASYIPPDTSSNGVVEAYDNEGERTVRFTGVSSHLAAVLLIRQFLRWADPSLPGPRSSRALNLLSGATVAASQPAQSAEEART